MKKILSLCLVAIMLLSAMIVSVSADEPAASVWNGTDVSTTLSGSGTEADPWLIQSAADLKYFADTVNADYNGAGGKTYAGEFVKLMVDVDLANHKWTPIGFREKAVFQGTFDGNGHTVSGLSNFENGDGNGTAAKEDISYRNGFFGGLGTVVSNSANVPAEATTDTVVKNLTVEGNIVIEANGHSGMNFGFGGLVGMINKDQYAGTNKVYITNVTSSINVTATGVGDSSCIGGVAGYAVGAVFTNVVNNGKVTVKAKSSYGTETSAYVPVGGFTGRAESCTFVDCVNNGDVNAVFNKKNNQIRVGGFVGQMYKKKAEMFLTFEGCVNNGDVYAEATIAEAGIMVVGGFLGGVYDNRGASAKDVWTDGTTLWLNYKVTFTNCANTGDVTTKSTVQASNTSTGGFVGSTYKGADGAANNGGGFKLIGCANTGKVTGNDPARASDFIGAIYTDKGANYDIVVEDCYASESLTGFVALKDWEAAFEGSEIDETKAEKRVKAIVNKASTDDNLTIVVVMVAVLALGTAFVASKKYLVRAR